MMLASLLFLVVVSLPATALGRSIAVNKDCFQFDEPIVITFDNSGTNPPPDFGDWIGLHDPGTLNPNSVNPQPILWTWTCGDQFCANAVSGGSVIYGPSAPNESGLDSWPLNAGNYVAVLTGGLAPYQARALSVAFTVMPAGQQCPGNTMAPPPPATTTAPPPPATTTAPPPPATTTAPPPPATTTAPPPPATTTAPPPPATTTAPPPPATTTPPPPPSSIKVLDGMNRFVQDARADILTAINFDQRLAPKFIRLAFHDCVGGCDGCVDMTNPDNGGLAFAIGSLDAVVQKYASRGLTRTDIWMLSAIVSSEFLQPADRAISWPFQWVGRKTCDELTSNNCGTKNGQAMSCAVDRGPDRHLPHSDIGTDTMLDFFREEFGWNAQQVVAIMGAHSVGSMRRFNVGFDGEEGWDLTNNILDNGYFIELVGQTGNPDAIPDFRQVVIQNNDNAFPHRKQFEAFVNGQQVTMLTADLALARQLTEDVNIHPDGTVLCNFRGFSNRCPEAPATSGHVKQYAQNFGVFLEDYQDVLNLMIDHGYSRSGVCPFGQVCELEVKS